MKTKLSDGFLPMFLLGLFLFYKYILQVSPSVMTDELMQHFYLSGAALGNLGASFFYTYLFAQLFAGPLLDKYNPRNITAVAIALSGSGAFGFAYSNTLLQAEMARGLIGIGCAFATVSYLKMASVYLPAKHFPLISGLLATAAMVGSIAGQAPMAFLVEKTSWQQSLILVAMMGLVLALSFLLLVKKPPSVTRKERQGINFQAFKALLGKRCNWYLMAYSGLAFSPLAVFGGLWGNPFLEVSLGLSKTEAPGLTSMMFLGLAVGGPLLGYIASRKKCSFKMMFFGSLLSLVSLTTVIYLPMSAMAVAVGLFLFGFGTGSFMLGFDLGKNLNHLGLAASVIALINTGDALIGAVSEPFIGKLLDLASHGIHQGAHYSLSQFHYAFALLPLYLLLALFCLIGIWRQNASRSQRCMNATPSPTGAATMTM